MRFLALLLASAVFALAACGGGGGTTATQTVTAQKQGGYPPTKAEFINQADALCQQFHADTASLRGRIQDLGQPTSTADLHRGADLIRQYADELSSEAAKLREIQPPRGDEAIINTWLSTAESGITAFHDLGDAYDSGDGQRIRSLGSEVQSRNDKASGIAQGYGLKVCGSD